MKFKELTPFLNFILKDNVVAITIAPFGIYIRWPYLYYQQTIRHESIHWQQQVEMLIIFFYVWYLAEWLLKLPFYGAKAYKALSFEREAYNNQNNLNYQRKPFAWFKLILKA